MTLKTCLRCDWEGETPDGACPNCARPLYVVGSTQPEVERAGERNTANEPGHVALSTALTPTFGGAPPSSARSLSSDPDEPTSRSARSTIAFVLGALLLMVAVGIRLNKEGEGPASTSVAPSLSPTRNSSSTSPSLSRPRTASISSPKSVGIGRESLTVEGIPFSFSVPSEGWWRNGDLFISKSTLGPHGAEAIILWTGIAGSKPFARACGQWWGAPDGSLADWAAEASRNSGTELVSGPADVTVGGYAAKHVVLTIRNDVACDPGFFHRWKAVDVGPFWLSTEVGDTIRIWLVRVGGTILYIEGDTHDYAGAHLKREVDKIVSSMAFD